MNNLAKFLTEYVITKGMIMEEERQEYEYGFIVAIEKGISLFISILIAIAMDMIAESILFFVIFIPLRKYAGGLHLRKYISCLILSCLTFSVVMLISKFLTLDHFTGLVLIICMDILIYIMYPAENINRIVDDNENKYFKAQLIKHLLINLLISTVCIIFCQETYVVIIVMTLLLITCTMFIGKVKYNMEKEIPSN